MSSIQQSMNHSVLPSALANAALLIAAPSLGCIKTYTRTFTDLCKAYGLPLPDLTHILEHRSEPEHSSMPSTMITPVKPSSMIISEKPVNCLGIKHDTIDLKELEVELSEITKEYETPEFNEEYYRLSTSSFLVSKSLGTDYTNTEEHDIVNHPDDIDASSFISEKYNATAFDNLDWFDVYESQTSLLLTSLSSFQVVTEPQSSSVMPVISSISVASPLLLKAATSSTINLKPVQKPFTCPLCNQSFSLKQSLLIHRVTEVCTKADRFLRPVTGGWTCTSCAKVFSSRAQAQRHTWGTLTCSPDHGMSCPVCQKEFAENACNFLVKHVKETHKEYFDGLAC